MKLDAAENKYVGLTVFGSVLMLSLIGLAGLLWDSRITIYSILLIGSLVITILVTMVLKQPKEVIIIICFGLLLRVLLLSLFMYLGYLKNGQLVYLRNGDATLYHVLAQGALEESKWIFWSSLPNYSYVVAIIYKIFGPDPNIVNIVNITLSILMIPLLFNIGKRLYSPLAGKIAAILYLMIPSVYLWSVSGNKDILLVLLILSSLPFHLDISESKLSVWNILLFILSIAAIGFIRFQWLIILIASIGYLVFRKFSSGKASLMQVIAIVVAIVLIILSGTLITRTFSALNTYESVQESSSIGESGISELIKISPRFRWMAQYVYVLVAPFPWQWLTIGQGINRIIVIEMIIWYLLFGTLIANLKTLRNIRQYQAILVPSALIALTVAFSIPNLGSIHRYRISAIIAILPVIASIIANIRDIKSKRHSF